MQDFNFCIRSFMRGFASHYVGKSLDIDPMMTYMLLSLVSHGMNKARGFCLNPIRLSK